ncbi:MAG: hypothetical protein Q4F88_05745 [Eubacteriales bacterium]|nr:hypothetical protein [Eubacteriales bacterium]
MEIDIIIDIITSCLINRVNGKEYDTEYKLSDIITESKDRELKNKGWKFDWSAPYNVGKDGIYLGVGAHLFAIACKESWDNENEGYVQFTAKNNLIEHNKETLRAKQIDWHNMYIDSYGAIALIHKYFKEI